MAISNVNPWLTETVEGDAEYVRLVSLVLRHDHRSLKALLDEADAHEVDRTLLLSIQQFKRTPRGDADTLRLAEAWFKLAPELLKSTRSDRRRKFILWTQAAARAYAVS